MSSHARDKTKKSFSILHRAQNLPSLLFVSKTLRYQHCWLHPLSVQAISVGMGTNYVAVVVPPESLAFQECKTTWASRSSTQIFQKKFLSFFFLSSMNWLLGRLKRKLDRKSDIHFIDIHSLIHFLAYLTMIKSL